METFVVHFDGSFSPWTTKIAAYGFTIHHDGELVKSGHGVVGQGDKMSCNVAEFSGLYKALFELLKPKYPSPKNIHVIGDSQLVIKMMTKVFKSDRTKKYYNFYIDCERMTNNHKQEGSHITFEWKRRCHNSEADALSTMHRLETKEDKIILK